MDEGKDRAERMAPAGGVPARAPGPAAGPTRDRKLVVGLVGGIGSGKSRVAQALARRGARVVAGDDLAHQALRQPETRARVAARWGADVLDAAGEIQRKKLADIVFRDACERKALEMLVHPWIVARIEEEVEKARSDPSVRLVVLDAAIMLEAGWDRVCDRLVFVEAPWEERLRRVGQQRGWTAQELTTREEAQLPLTEKQSRADHVITNSSSLDDLERQVDSLLTLWEMLPAREAGEPVALDCPSDVR